MKKPLIRGIVEYRYEGRVARMRFGADDTTENDQLSLKSKMTETGSGIRFDLVIQPRKEITIRTLSFETDLLRSSRERVFLNGYQSWTDSKEFNRHDIMKAPSRLLAPVLAKHRVTRYADYEFEKYSLIPGVVHGCSYGYVRPPMVKATGAGSGRNGRGGNRRATSSAFSARLTRTRDSPFSART